ncbi:hypothetical protein F5Y08DRAFT_204635 [Xylaria arbuscula]|nr:hypothetical protein F5Y08DRAFT_204635 [Xylaria arbuscula]
MDDDVSAELAEWYSTARPRRVDIIGDFGGKDLFFIDGDSLLLHSITASKVDYNVGFQLLHAIFAVEAFLTNLKDRGCRFHVIFFDNQTQLCVPSTTPSRASYKYEMTRIILIQHLEHFANQASDQQDRVLAFSFPSVDSEQFRRHLAQYPAAFLLCHDGLTDLGELTPNSAMFQYMIHQFLHLRHSVALINGTEFRSSRVIMPMITTSSRIPFLATSRGLIAAASPPKPDESLQIDWTLYQGTRHSEFLIAIALYKVLKTNRDQNHKTMATAMLLHSVLISQARLSERVLAPTWPGQGCTDSSPASLFLEKICREIIDIMSSNSELPLKGDLNWDLFDMIDGRLLLSLHAALTTRQLLPSALIDKARPLFTCVEEWSGVSLRDELYLWVSTRAQVRDSDIEVMAASPNPTHATILPFSHELLNKFLEPIKLQTAHLQPEANETKVFQELTHWHNAKRALESKSVQKKPGFFARKRNQEFMADTLVYSASLTNASGKLIEPKTIIVENPALPKKSLTRRTVAEVSKGKKKTGSSGKENARETALLIQARKLKDRNSATFRHWSTVADELGQEKALVKRFRKANKFFLSLTREDRNAIGAEVSLYLCDTLHRAWEDQSVATGGQQAISIGSLLFNQVTETLKLDGLTREVAAALQVLGSFVGIRNEVSPSQELLSRPLGFHSQISDTGIPTLLTLNPHEFQLEHCGPFLERSFDSHADERVPFEPDAWQRSVLDSIDANDSLFIVAPTSSGKTFISFYAMEKVLRADNDGVLVYVAPTKALVNQIAAEIQARFQKSYNHEGRSVWAIHTRDYRVNSSTGCQILVTVPHVLQIMLLSPSNANSWSKRIKRIIFDEVHCIGQAEDGIIWEQLLLMAPCPIIALSATVGNSEELCEWLRISQTSKGFKFKMITHGSRYSDLRVFYYAAPKKFEFNGLHRDEEFPVPGLDGPGRSPNFEHIHPVATLVRRAGIDLEELSLEPRDALSLWASMDRFQTERFPLDDSLNPSRIFAAVPKKADVLAWTRRLKIVLAVWMQDRDSPFDQVCQSLGSDRSNLHVVHKSPTSPGISSQEIERLTTFALLTDLHKGNGLPAILFNYDRFECEYALVFVLKQLLLKEREWKKSDKSWQKKMDEYKLWKASEDKKKVPKKNTEKLTKQEKMRENANADVSRWESFDPEMPLEQYSFADSSRLTPSELQGFIETLAKENIQPHLFSALRRGIAVHHAGMNRRYRQVVEILFRKGYLTVVFATGTLALGINMPCKTVAFIGDSAFLTTLNYRQGAGRAGRRGFDLLGNVVFANVGRTRVNELISSRLPDLKGHFPLTTTLVIRLLGLVNAAGQSSFVSGVVESLLTQNRLYLGGEEAGKSIQHHLRFSIEYLQRQHLLSADGKPINFAGLVGHLYFTENAVFAFHSLLKSGYFHRLCSNIHKDTVGTLRSMGLVMAHLFNRVRTPNLDVDSSSFALPRLPEEAEEILIRHNSETLEIFKTYASTFIEQYLHDVPDRHLPFTKIAAGGEEPNMFKLPGALPATKLRSPFSALSGLSDDFKSIRELCTDIRNGVFLEESAVPYIPIWPHDIATPFNSYIYDFIKNGDYIALTRDNKIKQGDVWFLLKDFSLVLATIVASLTNFVRADSHTDEEMIGVDDLDEIDECEPAAQIIETANNVKDDASRRKVAKKKVAESWDDEDEDEDGLSDGENEANPKEDERPINANCEPPVWEKDGRGLVDVLEAFTLLKQDFDEKFHKAWA